MKSSVVLSVIWLIYAVPQALEYGTSPNAKLLAIGYAIGVGAAILLAGLTGGSWAMITEPRRSTGLIKLIISSWLTWTHVPASITCAPCDISHSSFLP